MSVWIHHIETITPEHVYPQDHASAKMQEWIGDEKLGRMIRVLYKKSGIKQRYSVIESFDDNRPGDFLPLTADGRRREPTTAERNAIYVSESRRLSVALAEKALAACPAIAAQDITHVVTVSCTGFSNPGPDYHIVNDLGLAATTQRYNLGFMAAMRHSRPCAWPGSSAWRIPTRWCWCSAWSFVRSTCSSIIVKIRCSPIPCSAMAPRR